MNKNELEQSLLSRGVPIDSWGKDLSKTFAHLERELEDGESRLELSEKGLLRVEEGVGIDIFYIKKGRLYRLIETMQIFADGRTRTRENSTSIGEKMKPGELPFQTARRALKEELGIDGVENYIETAIFFNEEDRQSIVSNSYPGLLTKRKIHTLNIYLTENDFKPEGYRELQEDKTTIFEWREVTSKE